MGQEQMQDAFESDLLRRAEKRCVEAMRAATGQQTGYKEMPDGGQEVFVIHLGIPAGDLETVVRCVAGATQRVMLETEDFGAPMHGALARTLLLGYFLRDEQLRAEAGA